MAHTPLTPAGIQPAGELFRRRALVAGLNVATYAVMMAGMAVLLGAGGWTATDVVIFICFGVGLPWSVLGFWNALIGLWLLHGAKDGFAEVAPFAAAGDAAEPIRVKTAVLMTLRNEDPSRAFARLRAVKESLDATGEGQWFSYFILSDTNRLDIELREDEAVAAWKREAGVDAARIHYRRRLTNEGFKAGNVRDFCEQRGGDYELMLPLDADSLMSGAAILRLARIMQAYPRLGILQSLVVGMPSSSAFARIFQFGMRHGMRAYTMGSAWWTGDCGPFWGHNAMVRIAPFREFCELPVLAGGPPLGGHVMSHDQVEATLMRRAGYEARVLPLEDGSWEENPPTILEFVRRDLRWCLGNLQYLKLLDIPGLKPMSRFQLVWAILMFLGVPAFTLMIALSPIKAIEDRNIADYPAGLAMTLYGLFFLMYLMPKLAGFLDILLTRGGVARYGGAARFLAGVVTELLFSFLQGAVSTFRTTLFMIGLVFGRSEISWGGQARDAHGVSLRTAFAGLWPQLFFGLVICGSLLALSPALLIWSLPLTAGYLLAIPFAMITASPELGARLEQLGLCAIPEEIATPDEVRAVRVAPAAQAQAAA
ncbi:glucans biosynthesis glucosyltransferase MdoH [Terrarubrum flagellatum]|uniref:glucans biosynthesis glucosyltransferase MdoH n=1 Tax=Terrirubrum flagellatum TaxID=2895980 RepID=UPI0031455AA6